MKEFPIVGYLGVHDQPNRISNYKLFQECGFTHSLWMFLSPGTDNVKSVQSACAMADRCGLSVIACTNSMFAAPEGFAEKMKDVAGFGGYFITDEPAAGDIQRWQETYIKAIRKVDDKHIIYVNLLPNYATQAIGTDTYEEYLQTASMLDTTQVSFDFYPITNKQFRRDEWYKNLEQIADHSRKVGKPFWGFILSTSHGDYPVPTLAQLRIQTWTNLAYGAQGLQYFTYQTPQPVDGFVFKNGPIESDYITRTKTWYTVRDMNAEIAKVSPLFNGATDFKVVRTKPLLWWSRAKDAVRPQGFDKIKVEGRDGAIISTFKHNGREYCVIVNSSYKDNVKVTIDTKTYNYINKKPALLVEEVAQSTYKLEAGDCLLFVKKKPL